MKNFAFSGIYIANTAGGIYMSNSDDFRACYKCQKRRVGCHSKCHDYLREVANHQIEKERRRKEKEMENICGRKR
mgnify:CR=1 FL=1